MDASAPGRVNLIGEHTDYNGGFVLPVALPQETTAFLRLRDDDMVEAWSASRPDEPGSYRLGTERRTGSWIDYIAGTTLELSALGYGFCGFDLALRSGIPIGAGLSSSAALEIALLRALRMAFGFALDDVAMAKLAQAVENGFVGARVGIMDPMAVSLARRDRALFLDTRSLDYELIPIPEDIELVVIHSGIEHSIAGGEYNLRREESERAARLLGLASLRELTADRIPDLESLPDPERKRARHVRSENERVLAAVEALRRDDPVALGRLLDESHDSLRDDYEVSLPEIDILVRILRAEPGVFGARITGGGFGGSVLAAARRGSGTAAAAHAAEAYGAATGRHGHIVAPEQARTDGR